LIKSIDKLLFSIIKKERGGQCEIHNSLLCDSIAPMHILAKGEHPRLRFSRQNIILAGWFCSHYWTHHNADHPKAVYAFQRIRELRGKNYKDELARTEATMPKFNMIYLKTLEMALKKQLET